MPRRPYFDERVVQIANHQDGLISSSQLQALGVSRSTLARRNRVGGMWNRVLPGVHLVSGVLGERQRLRAALLYAGPDALLTGYSATSLYGLRSEPARALPGASSVDVLIPHERRRTSYEFVRVERTLRMPSETLVHGLACAPVCRAVADAARRSRSRADVLALVTEAVRRDLVDIRSLQHEAHDGSRRGSRWLREAVEHAVHGSWSAPEAHLRSGFVKADAEQPAWNVRLETPDGVFLAIVDGYFDDAGLAIEVDSRAHHSSDDDWRRTLDRSARLSAQGVVVMHVTSDRIWNDVTEVVREIRAARAVLLGRPRLDLIVRCERTSRG